MNSNFRMFAALCLICGGLSAFFLLKGEDTSYSGFRSDRSFGGSGISALTYYLVWSKSDRKEIARTEGQVAVLRAMAEAAPSSALPDLMKRNIDLAIMFGIAAAILAIAPRFAQWRRRIRNRR
jgi:hypothetical protein